MIKRSSIPGSGKGLFTRIFIPKGTTIVEYKGRISTWKEADHADGTNAYIFYVHRNHVIDASTFKMAFARYANDAEGLEKSKGVVNNGVCIIEDSRVFIQAARDIEPGSEILVGYGKQYWDVIRRNKNT